MKIDRNVPLPRPVRKYPFDRMLPGDSIFAPDEDTQDLTAAAAKNYARYHGWKVTARKEAGGCRIWRVS